MTAYLAAASCVPSLPWCAWEALKLAVLLGDVDAGFAAASRLAKRAPREAWESRETTPRRVAELVAMLAIGRPELGPFLHLLDLLLEAADEEDVASMAELRLAVREGHVLPDPDPPDVPSGLAPSADPAGLWEAARQAYLAGQLRDDHLLFEPAPRSLAATHPVADLLRIRRDF